VNGLVKCVDVASGTTQSWWTLGTAVIQFLW
jgi:hypothetical protein